jgi:hypothetical protein
MSVLVVQKRERCGFCPGVILLQLVVTVSIQAIYRFGGAFFARFFLWCEASGAGVGANSYFNGLAGVKTPTLGRIYLVYFVGVRGKSRALGA